MQMTLKKLVELAQLENISDESRGYELAAAMAHDRMSYAEAHDMLRELKHLLDHTERCVSKAAFRELSRDNRPMDVANMSKEY